MLEFDSFFSVGVKSNGLLGIFSKKCSCCDTFLYIWIKNYVALMALTVMGASKSGTAGRSPSFHGFRSGAAILEQGTFLFVAPEDCSITRGWTWSTLSELSQMTLANVVFLISSSCLGVNFPGFSYQNLSPIFNLTNWSSNRHVTVGPRMLSSRGFSLKAPEYRSISSTCLANKAPN